MQWTDGPNAGFTSGKPWLPVPPTSTSHNVASELKNPNSILEFYKRLLALRHQSRTLLDGQYIPLNQDDPNVLSYLRKYKHEMVLVALNMSEEAHKVSFDLSGQGLVSPKSKLLLTTASEPRKDGALRELSLEPFEVYLAEILK